jgi:HEAT repeat protein
LPTLIEQLGCGNFAERERASRVLVALELAAVPALQEAINSKDTEVRRRAALCLDEIQARTWHSLGLAAVRLLLRSKPEGLAAVLIQYLPYAGDEAVEEEIYFGVDHLARQARRADAALMSALDDPLAARRALAGCIVGARGTVHQRFRVRRLLGDPDAEVRLRTAQGLLASGEKASLPTLVALLENSSVALCWQAEELRFFVESCG